MRNKPTIYPLPSPPEVPPDRGTVGAGRFTKQVSDMIKLPLYQYSVIVGLLLSDG
jgi:hypothetical protein